MYTVYSTLLLPNCYTAAKELSTPNARRILFKNACEIWKYILLKKCNSFSYPSQNKFAFFIFPYPMISSPRRNILFNQPVLLIPHLTNSCRSPGCLLKGQTLMQFAQSVPLAAQKGRQVSALMCHARIPGRLGQIAAQIIGSDIQPHN